MAYQVTRKKKISEQLELVGDDGQVSEVITVSLDADSMAERLSIKYTTILKLQQELKKTSVEFRDKKAVLGAYEQLGRATVEMMEAVFGEVDTEKIRKFYGNNYVEMLQEIMPFITNVILPQVRNLAKQNRKEVLSKYNRKTRRAVKRTR